LQQLSNLATCIPFKRRHFLPDSDQHVPEFLETQDPVKDKLKRFGLFERIGEAFFFATIGAAVDEYEATHRAEWIMAAPGSARSYAPSDAA
jgi:hypothetical protein